MKAVRVIDKQPVLVDAPSPSGNGVRVKVVTSSICGSDLHMMETGFFGDNIIGHEFAGLTDSGKAVAIEPLTGCGHCGFCDVVMDAVGSSASLKESAEQVKPMGRIGLVGMFWEPTEVAPSLCIREVELIPAAGYHCKSPTRSFDEARDVLHAHPQIAQALISHRYPLDGVSEAFAAAGDRAAGAIKVVFDIA